MLESYGFIANCVILFTKRKFFEFNRITAEFLDLVLLWLQWLSIHQVMFGVLLFSSHQVEVAAFLVYDN